MMGGEAGGRGLSKGREERKDSGEARVGRPW